MTYRHVRTGTYVQTRHVQAYTYSHVTYRQVATNRSRTHKQVTYRQVATNRPRTYKHVTYRQVVTNRSRTYKHVTYRQVATNRSRTYTDGGLLAPRAARETHGQFVTHPLEPLLAPEVGHPPATADAHSPVLQREAGAGGFWKRK